AEMVAGAQPDHSERAATPEGARLRQGLEPRARRIAAEDDYAIPSREARRNAKPRGRAHHGRLGHALRQSVDRLAPRHAAESRLRAYSDRAALSAIFRRHHGDS